MNNDLNFTYGEGASVVNGCGVTLKGEFWYFGGGGSANERQVSSIRLDKHSYSSIQGEQDRWVSNGSSKRYGFPLLRWFMQQLFRTRTQGVVVL